MFIWRLFFCRFSSSSGGGGRELRRVMQYVPTSVVVVTTRAPGGGGESVLRGVTCSSFTSVSAKPPVVSFCMQNPSRFHSLLTESGLFAVNILSETQANLSIRFSTPLAQGTEEENSQFKRVPHAIDTEFNLPLLEGCVGHLLCSKREFHQVGDHFVWYGDVLKTIIANGYDV
ncbi:NADH-dependent FAD reductase-like [Symsagittifera roscoffensis]|uniref:NADH-dependent FAD reductase-like n=1 Tax=Symsagittifera roscoffensis TaxID=84072 RepID=UPI00307B4117